MPRRFAWASLPDERAAAAAPEGPQGHASRAPGWSAACETCIDELAERGLRIRPHAWISNEWFSPDDTPGIAIPFYLAHPRLMRLERKMIIDVEGGTVPECMRILRHEAGHVVQARLSAAAPAPLAASCSAARRPAIRDYYRPNPASRRYVQHLPLWYAQSHPDEDFAETFAVWLTPRSNWRRRYAGWPALKKLEYVDELMAEIAGQQAAAHAPAQRRPAEPAHPDAWPSTTRRSERTTRSAIRATYDRDLLRHLLRRSEASPVAGGVRLSAAQPREDQADRLEVDGRVPADAGRRFR